VHSKEKAQQGLQLMQEAILETVTHNNQQGIRNSDIARALGLESDFEGKQHNYLSWSAIGLLVNQGRLRYECRGRNKLYFLPKQSSPADGLRR
jgi:hypothetical protein